MSQPSIPGPGAPAWDALHHLLDATAELISDDDVALTAGLLTEGARCSCAVWNIHDEETIAWVVGQAMLQLAQAYLLSPWADQTVLPAIIDRLSSLPAEAQAQLTRTAAAATP